MAGRLLLSSFLGGIIGLEREIHGRPAGFRTHLLVSLGSCLFVASSIEFYTIFGNFSGKVPVGVDPARVAAQVVTGIGFLGAGAIIRDQAAVRGLTTAACLWVAAGLGVACGIGMYGLAVVATAVALANLLLLKEVEKKLSRDTYISVRVVGEDTPSFISRVEAVLAGSNLTALQLRFDRDVEHQRIGVDFQVKQISKDTPADLLHGLGALEGVKRVRLE
ncbi:MgtC/SapB family protein [Geomonas sp. RF6]|nr:MgtC/SapB family protein [Geomonas sp. RF6]UFS72851.1 MgtC/SapB family protein [Geomonas sp. RF6]